MELLSSVDYIMTTEFTNDADFIMNRLAQCNTRNKNLFANKKFVDKAINHILEYRAMMLQNNSDPSYSLHNLLDSVFYPLKYNGHLPF